MKTFLLAGVLAAMVHGFSSDDYVQGADNSQVMAAQSASAMTSSDT